jgi:two-component system, NtrC family, nitrogen regulation sensor histidine kinase NtrY
MISSASSLAIRTLARTTLIVGLAVGAIMLLGATHLFATALLCAIGCTWVSVDLYQMMVQSAPRDEVRGLNSLPLREEHLQSLLDTVQAILLVLEPDGQVSLANRAAHRFVGMPVTRLEQISMMGKDTARRISAMTAPASDVMRLADGQAVLVSVAQFATPQRAPQRLVSLQRVAGDLDAVELKAWHDMMRVLNHEMMNSLTPIASLSESLQTLLEQTPVRDADPRLRELQPAIEAIGRRSRGLLQFTERYRQVAELPQAKLEAVPAAEFLANLERLLRTTFAAAEVTYEQALDASIREFRADPLLMEQALINLLKNAIDASRSAAQPRVRLELALLAERWTFRVGDNGQGVDAGLREQLFVPFFSTKPGGSGIGLALARNIARAHGGTLDYAPGEAGGSIFSLTWG